jgi:hypothetical protein
VEHDEDVRTSCFTRLAVLQAQHGDELAYGGILSAGFPFRGRRVPFLNYQKGIYRAAVQRGPAALSIQTSARSPYADVETVNGFSYDYRAGSIDQPDNRALRAAAELGVPIVYFVASRSGLYQPLYHLPDRRIAPTANAWQPVSKGSNDPRKPGSLARTRHLPRHAHRRRPLHHFRDWRNSRPAVSVRLQRRAQQTAPPPRPKWRARPVAPPRCEHG